MFLSDVCLSVAYIGPKSRTEGPGKTKIGTEISHATRDSDTTFNVKGQGQGHQAALLTAMLARQWLQRWAWERVGRGKLLLRCHLLGAHGGREGRGHTVAAARPPTAC